MKAYVILPAALGLLGACGQSAARFAAVETGDVSNAPAECGSPTASSAAARGEGGARTRAGSGAIERMPYVQKVTSSSADILVTTRPRSLFVLVAVGVPA